MNKAAVILVILPCLVALVLSNTNVYYGQPMVYGYQQQGQGRGVGQYAAYAAQSTQALRQSRLFNYLLGGLYFLNLFNVTGNRIQG